MHVYADVEIDIDEINVCWILPTESVKKDFVFWRIRSKNNTNWFPSIGSPFLYYWIFVDI